jgi:2-polyprenyl-6-methoxyphenol hydroxylase-like FAD-dependent oxidoreductase
VGTQELPRLLGPDYPAQLGIPRPALHELLLDSCRELGVKVQFGLTTKSLEVRDSGVQVVLSDGRTATYDAVIGADGMYSDLRTRLFGSTAQPMFTGLAAWRIRTSRPRAADGIVLYRGGKYWAGFNPVTDCQGYIFMVEPVANRTRVSQDELIPRVRQLLAEYNGLVAQLLPSITDPTNVLYRPIEVVALPPPWYRGSAILIGDAAHAPSPSLGAGALIAIEDAVVLAEELAACDSVSSAFEKFMTRRYKRCQLVVDASIELAAWQKDPLQIQLDPDRLHAKVGAELSKSI